RHTMFSRDWSSDVCSSDLRIEEIRSRRESAETLTRGKTILVIDDSPTIRKLISGKLEKSGHNVFCSGDGVEAMERLQDLVPDLGSEERRVGQWAVPRPCAY